MDELKRALDKKFILDKLSERISRFIPERREDIQIKNAVLIVCNVLEGLVNLVLSRYYLGKNIEVINKEKVNHFWINVLVEINLARKLEIIGGTNILDIKVLNMLRKINDIRNDLAHYPHRIYKRKKNHLMYGNRHIFNDIEALKMFYNDFDIIMKQVTEVINTL